MKSDNSTTFNRRGTMFLNESTNTTGGKVNINLHKINYYLLGINICFRSTINTRYKKLYTI